MFKGEKEARAQRAPGASCRRQRRAPRKRRRGRQPPAPARDRASQTRSPPRWRPAGGGRGRLAWNPSVPVRTSISSGVRLVFQNRTWPQCILDVFLQSAYNKPWKQMRLPICRIHKPDVGCIYLASTRDQGHG